MLAEPLIWLAIVSLVVTCITAIGAKSLRDFSRHELEELCLRRNAEKRLRKILRYHTRFSLGVETFAVLMATLAVVSVTSWLMLHRKLSFSDDWTVLLPVFIGLGVAFLAARVWFPWAIAQLWAEPFLFYTWRFWQFIARVVAPLSWGTYLVSAIFFRLAGRTPEVPTEESLEEEIRAIVTEGQHEGLLEEDAREMIEGVIELRDAHVSEIMTPRTDMHMLHVDMPWEDLLEYVIRVGHTRIPVFEKNRDDVIGILYSKDLLPELTKTGPHPCRPLRGILRKPHFVPETKAVDALLQNFQQTRNHLAVVLDEYGGVSGLVTIEDVLEEIVGEIIDEYDEDLVEEIQKIDNQTCEALGRAHIDEINEILGTNLPEDADYDTIGGFVFSQLGRVPTPNDFLLWQDTVRITVLEASARRIDRVRLDLVDENRREIA